MNREKLSLIIIAVLISFLVFFSFRAGLFAGLENFFEDSFFVRRPINKDIVIIAIDDESIKEIGQWPWPREVFAKALKILNELEPKAVGLDVMFSEASRLGPDDDKELETSLENLSYPVILPIEISDGKILEPLEIFKNRAALGYVNLILDKDGVVRKFLPQVEFQNKNTFSFSLEILKKSKLVIPNEVALKGQTRIAYAGPPNSFLNIPFYKVLSKEAPASIFENKIVLIGATAPDLHDEQLTPFSRGKAMPGVEIQASIVNMILNGFEIKPLNPALAAFWIFFAGILSAFLFILFKRSLKPLFFNLGLGGLYIILVLILVDNDIFPNFIHLNASWILSTAGLFSFRYFIGEKERRETRNLFSRYVSRDVLEEILKDPQKVSLGGKEIKLTILFSDIRGFTTLAEKLSSKELVSFLNEYFEVMSGEVLKHKGILDKYIGDAIMAFWGAPIEDHNQADNAVKAALGMIKALENLNQNLKARNMPAINIGVGIYTGLAVVGNIGSQTRFDYTAIGDSVNVASRLEGLNKIYGTEIIIGEDTKKELKNDYNFRLIGTSEVKGRKQPINIYTR